MKKLLKNKFFIGGLAFVLTVAVALTAILLWPASNEHLPAGSQSPASSEGSAPNIPDVSNPTGETDIPDVTPSNETDISDITVDVGTDIPPTTGNEPAEKEEPVKPADPIVEVKPPKGDSETGGVDIGGNPPQDEAYDCGSADHHCRNAEYHAYLLNLELEGCPNCGSHSCKSFYAVNEWGHTQYDPTICPKYDEKKDPNKYCPECGRKKWSLDNPTGCFRYLQDTQCECGEYVEGNTCHHH